MRSHSAAEGKDRQLVCDSVTWPLRTGWRATRRGFRLAEKLLAVAWRGTEWVMEAAVSGPREAPADVAADEEASGDIEVGVVVMEPPPVVEQPPTAPPAPAGETLSAQPPKETLPAEPIRPPHVSEELELVESFAEAGAENGAGATVHVEEPWKGYAQMTAQEVITRLGDASREELAAVELYERAHRGRQTVMAAAARRLRRATAADRDRR